MAEQQQQGGYGYTTDEVKQSTFHFGLNAGATFLKKFEWIPNGGKDGAEVEALDVIFTINGTDKNYRLFPVTKAFQKDTNAEITDPNSQEMKDAFADFNAKITHILHVFQDRETIKATFSRPIKSFKEFCGIAASILPNGFNTKPLDIFLSYQWKLADGKERTYLEIPKNMKSGKWLTAAMPGPWKEVKAVDPDDNMGDALHYVNQAGQKHEIAKNGWFVKSNYGVQQRGEGVTDNNAGSHAPSTDDNAAFNGGDTPVGATPPPAAAW